MCNSLFGGLATICTFRSALQVVKNRGCDVLRANWKLPVSQREHTGAQINALA